jgi:hypothetical protein
LSNYDSDDLIDAVCLVNVNQRSILTSCPNDCEKTYQRAIKKIAKVVVLICASFAQSAASFQLLER